MTPLDEAITASLIDLRTCATGGDLRVEGRMRFGADLEGPPGRVHGGLHPLVRTLPILARLLGSSAAPTRIHLDAALGKPLPLEEDVPFDGTFEAGPPFRLVTRFRDDARLVAEARPLADGDIPTGDELARVADVLHAAASEPFESMRVIGVPYRIAQSAVTLDLRDRSAIETTSHLARCLGEGAPGLVAFATQLDALGASGRGVAMRHPHFTKHISLAFDLDGLAGTTPLVLLADRTTVEEVAGAVVHVKGRDYPGARVHAYALAADGSRCFAHACVHAHPVDPARYEGFEQMRKLRSA